MNMLNIKNGIGKSVLNAVGVKYYPSKLSGYFVEAKTLPQKWDMLIPVSVQDILATHSDGALTYFVNGTPSKHHDTSDSNRSCLKAELKGIATGLYADMDKHVHAMLLRNAQILCYQKKTGSKITSYHSEMLTEYQEQNAIAVREEYKQLCTGLTEALESVFDIIMDDMRLSGQMKDFLREKIQTDPEKALAVLIFISLFAENDKDSFFECEFALHYLTEAPKPKRKSDNREHRLVANSARFLDKVAAGAEIPGEIVSGEDEDYLVIRLSKAQKEYIRNIIARGDGPDGNIFYI